MFYPNIYRKEKIGKFEFLKLIISNEQFNVKKEEFILMDFLGY